MIGRSIKETGGGETRPLIIRPNQIQSITGISKSQALWMEKNVDDFPKRVRITPGLTGWRSDEIYAYIHSRPRINPASE